MDTSHTLIERSYRFCSRLGLLGLRRVRDLGVTSVIAGLRHTHAEPGGLTCCFYVVIHGLQVPGKRGPFFISVDRARAELIDDEQAFQVLLAFLRAGCEKALAVD